jgi:phage tail-like protein
VAETPAAAPGTWVDPYPAYNFKVKIQDQEVAHFIECSGLDVEVETFEYREAGQSQVVHQIPTLTTYHDVTLRYGLTSSPVMWNWFLATTQGRPQRQIVTIFLLDSAGTTPVLQWALNGAYPKRWKGAALRATAREVAIEEIVLAYESLGRGGV